jgi:hypothetical protein
MRISRYGGHRRLPNTNFNIARAGGERAHHSGIPEKHGGDTVTFPAQGCEYGE